MSGRFRVGLGGAVLVAALVLFWGLILAPALPGALARRLEPLAALVLGPLCHRLPERSLWLEGAPLGVCARCAAIYFGFGAGIWAAFAAGTRRAARLWLIGIAPMALDGLLSMLRIWESPLGYRLATGVVAGASLARLLWPVYAELWSGASGPRRVAAARSGGWR
jgi:uncharacterized membrane protein